MEFYTGNIMTLSNSIIGVSILAMPFCFKQCGIILSILMLIISSIITRLTCHFLLKSATMARRRTFELLAFHAFGTTGKFMVELGIIGFLMGTCIAFFVIIGDLGPAIIAKIMGTKPTDTLRTSILIGVALFCVLPLGLLKNVDSLHSVSTATIGFYFCLVLKTFSESAVHFTSSNWLENVELWRPVGVLQCLPIFSMALSCQTQLFEIYETVSNPTLDKMNYIVRIAVNICVAVYICVGFFGYTAFASQPFTGNILMSFSQSPVTDAMKIGFVLSVAFSFPLVIFPCRASLYSLLFKKGYTPYEGTISNHIPEAKFKFLTLIIVTTSLIIGILIPNIEVVLGLLGSTIGTMICMIFPVTCFICISTKNTNERLVAQFLLFIGVIVMVMGTYANLYAMEQINDPIVIEKPVNPELKNENLKHIEIKLPLTINEGKVNIKATKKETDNKLPIIIKDQPEEIRLEPPQPVEPQEIPQKIVVMEQVKSKPLVKSIILNDIKQEDTDKNRLTEKEKGENLETKQHIEANEMETKKADEVDIEAIKKEDTELQEAEKSKNKDAKEEKEKEVDLIKTIEQYKEEQKKLIEEQKELIEERKQTLEKLKEQQKIELEVENEVRRKAASQIIEIAKKAIEQLAPETIKKSNEPKDAIGHKASETFMKNPNDNQNEKEINANKVQNEISKITISDKLDKIVIAKPSENFDMKNILPNTRLIPFPMAVNKTLNEILYKNNDINIQHDANTKIDQVRKEESQQKIEKLENNELPKVALLSKISVNAKISMELENNSNKSHEIKAENNKIFEKPAKNDEKLEKYAENKEKVEKLTDQNKKVPKKINENLNNIKENKYPAQRDILSNNDVTDKILRVKRQYDYKQNQKQKTDNENENCERSKHIFEVKTDSPLIKLMTEVTKTEFKFDSNIINAVKTQLNSESIHLKRK